MPFDGSGNFNRVMNWVSDAAANIKIVATRHDAEDDNLAAGLSNTLTKDGQSQPTADIPLNGKKLTNVGAPVAGTDAATKAYVDAIRTFNTAITLSGAAPQATINFTAADVSFGARTVGTPAGSLSRFVWNNAPTLGGVDQMLLDDAGTLSLNGSTVGRNIMSSTTSGTSWAAMATGFGGWLIFDKSTGQWITYGTNVSVVAGAAATPTQLTALDSKARMTIGPLVTPANTRSALAINGDLTIVNGFSLGFNAYYDTVAATFKAAQTGFGATFNIVNANGAVMLQRSSASAAADAAYAMSPVMSFDVALGTLFSDNAFQYGNGVNNVYQQHKGAVSVGYYRKTGVGNFSWSKSTDGLQTGGGLTSLMTLDDAGSLACVGTVTAGQTFAANSPNVVLANNGGSGACYMRPNGVGSVTGQTVVVSSGDMTVGGNISAPSFNGVVNVGNYGVGSDGKQITSGAMLSSRNTSVTATHHQFWNTNASAVGSITTNGAATAYGTSSDENLKDFTGAYDPLAAIDIIRRDPVRAFNWKADGAPAVGWGAQSSYEVSPDLAVPGVGAPGDEDYVPWGVDQGKRTPYLWAALTHALDRIDELEARLAALEAA